MLGKAGWRGAWLSGTVLGTVATLLAPACWAQPAPNAHPTGGVVTAGSASIGSSASTTTITQSSQRAAINWQSFDVGSKQTVDFAQPSTSAVALNRVIGPNPSQIAGRINANGQIILINQSGVIFYQGAQVNSAGLIVSAAGMSDANFMAGNLLFDQAAQPNAAVVNQGRLTVRQAGLVALVAPQVANSGVIDARLGHVVLAGAKTATLDLYGDGLLSLDVNNEVTQAPTGPDGKPVAALVTNTGVIRADGGTVQLTARQADGLVQNLVQAGGKIAANSVGTQTGTVVLGGLGGSIVLSGMVAANGSAPGSTGGQVQVDASQGVTLASGARVSASGPAGGGTVAIGTTLARAKGGPGTASRLTAQTVTMAPGARIAANATGTGNGGRVTLLSSQVTSVAGSISAQGGPQGGDGGFVETSGQTLTIGASAMVDTSAARGLPGMWLVDPTNYTIANTGGDETPAQVVTALETSNVTIAADNDVTVTDAIDATGDTAATNSLILQAGRSILINASITLNGGGFTATANDSADLGTALPDRGSGAGVFTMAPGVTIDTSVGSQLISIAVGPLATNSGGSGGGDLVPGAITLANLESGGGDIATAGGTGLGLTGSINAGAGGLTMNSGGAITQTGGSISAAILNGSAADSASLTQAGNLVGTLGAFTTASGFALTDNEALLVNGPVRDTGGGVTVALTTTTGDLTLSGAISAANDTLALTSAGAIAQSGGAIQAATLTGSAATSASLARTGNLVGTLDTFTTTAGFALTDNEALLVNGPVSDTGAASTLALTTETGDLTLAGTVSASNLLDLVSAGAISQTGGAISAATLNVATTGAGDVTLGAANHIGVSSGITVNSGDLVLVDDTSLTLTGSQSAHDLFFEIAAQGDALNIGVGATAATLDATAGSGARLSLVADRIAEGTGSNAITAAGGTVELAPFTATTAVSVAGSAGNHLLIATSLLGSISTGTVVVGRYTDVPNGGSLVTSADSLTVDGAVDLTTRATTLGLYSAGAITQTGGTIQVATLTGGAATSASLTQAGNLVGTLGAFNTAGGFALSDNQALVVSGSVSDSGSGQTVALTTKTGSLTLSGAISAANDTLDLVSAGAITQSGGSIQAATLSGSAVTSASLTQTGNLIGTLGAFTTTTGFALTDNAALLVNGPVSDTGRGQTVALTTTGDMTLSAVVRAARDTLDLNAGGAITQSGGSISAATLTGSASGSASLTQAANLVGTLAAFSTAGGFALTDNEALLVNGPVSDSGTGQTVALTSMTGGVTLSGAVNAANDTLDLTSAGAIAQTGGAIEVAILTGSTASSASLAQAGNLVGTLGAFTTGAGFALTDNEALLVNGPVSDTGAASMLALTTETGDLTLAGAVSASNLLDLISAGAISQTGGAISAATLKVDTTGAGDVTLGAANHIGVSSGITVNSGDLVLVDDTSLTLTGSQSAHDLFFEIAAEGDALNIGVGATAATLDATAASGARVSLVADRITAGTGSNAITAAGGTVELAPFTATTAVSVAGSAGNHLLIATSLLGSISTGTVVVGRYTDVPNGGSLVTSADSLTLDGAVDLTTHATTLGLYSAGAITQTGGAIQVATLTGTAATSASLTQAGNQVGTLGAFSTAGGFALTDNQALLVNGPVSDSGSGQTVALTTKTGGLTLNSTISAASDTLDLVSAGTITQTGGSIQAATLIGSAVTSASLTQAGNLIGALGAFTTAAGFALIDNTALLVNGPLSDTGAASTLTLTVEAGDLTLAGAVSASNLLDLISAGAITQAGGSISAATLTGGAATSASLTQEGNLVGALGAFTTTGGFALTDNETLQVNGPVSDSGSGQTVALTTTAGGLTLAGAINAANDTLALVSAEAITQSGGAITAATLTGNAATSASLTQAANLVGTLGGFTTTAGFALTDTAALLVNGPVSDTGAASTLALTIEAGDLTLAGNVNATHLLDLISDGAISQTGGSIGAATLTGSAATSASLTRAGNVVGTLAAFTTTNGFALTDSAALLVSGTVSDTGNGTSVALTTMTGGLTLSGAVSAANDTLDLISAGAITQTGGSIQSAMLTGSATAASLTQSSNLVGTLGAFTTTGGFALTDDTALLVNGPVSDFGSGQTVALTTKTGGLTLSGAISAPHDTLDLVSAGAIVQTSGTIQAATLTGSAATSARLTQAGNLIGTLGAFTTSSGFALIDSTALLVSGPFSDSGSGQTVTLSTTTGDLTLSGAVSAPHDTLDLNSAGTIAQTGGAISVATLAGGAAISARLTQAGNLIGALDTFTTTAGFALTDNEALLVSGPVSDTGSGQMVALATKTGGLTLSGAIRAANDTLDLISAGAITQTGGSIQVATLAGSAATSASLTQADNLVSTLGAFTTSAGFSLTDNAPLLVTGPVSDSGSGQTVTLTTMAGDLTLSGAVGAPHDTLDLISAAAIAQINGSISVAALTGSAVTSASLTQATNQIGALGAFTSSAGFALTDSTALLVSGPVRDTGNGQTLALTTTEGGLTLSGAISAASDTLDLISAGAIIQTGGAIEVATLTGRAATSASLTQANNLVGALGAFTTTAGFALTDSEALSMSGPVNDSGSGQTVALTTTTGDLTLTGAVNAANDALELISADAITQTGGAIQAATLTGRAATSASLKQTGNLVGTLDGFTAGSSFALTDNKALTVTGSFAAPLIVIDTQGFPLTMASGTTIITGGITPPDQLTITTTQVPTVTDPGLGAYFITGTFMQQGSATITTLPGGSGTSILVIDVAGGQNVTFDPILGLNPGLAPTASTTWLVLELGTPGSHVTGNVNLQTLTLSLPAGSTPTDFSVQLTGTASGVAGKLAASRSGVIPLHGATLQFNYCPIGTVSCVVLSGPVVPVGNPLQNLSIGMLDASNDDSDLLLPLVSDEDLLACLQDKNCP